MYVLIELGAAPVFFIDCIYAAASAGVKQMGASAPTFVAISPGLQVSLNITFSSC
jgi:hypothetical protein